MDNVLNERGKEYGSFQGHAAVTQELKQVMSKHLLLNDRYNALNEADKAVVDEALDMIAHKLGRVLNGNPLHEDTYVDIAGYALLVPRNTTGAPF